MQELFSLIQTDIKPDYVVSISGWNEVDAVLFSDSKVSSLSLGCDYRANTRSWQKSVRIFFMQFALVSTAQRFLSAFMSYGSADQEKRDLDNVNIYPLF